MGSRNISEISNLMRVMRSPCMTRGSASARALPNNSMIVYPLEQLRRMQTHERKPDGRQGPSRCFQKTRILNGASAASFHVSTTQPSHSDRKTWPLHYVTPPNKPLCRPDVCIGEGKKRHPKDHFNAGVSQHEALKKRILPSLS